MASSAAANMVWRSSNEAPLRASSTSEACLWDTFPRKVFSLILIFCLGLPSPLPMALLLAVCSHVSRKSFWFILCISASSTTSFAWLTEGGTFIGTVPSSHWKEAEKGRYPNSAAVPQSAAMDAVAIRRPFEATPAAARGAVSASKVDSPFSSRCSNSSSEVGTAAWCCTILRRRRSAKFSFAVVGGSCQGTWEKGGGGCCCCCVRPC
mmetsp:Transcript_54322/g.115958  ORF Transcript_54322/g.115958 Transcript_54322/m.115958 type:complete len:208 (-) Transcript_54322:32-655(-)